MYGQEVIMQMELKQINFYATKIKLSVKIKIKIKYLQRNLILTRKEFIVLK